MNTEFEDSGKPPKLNEVDREGEEEEEEPLEIVDYSCNTPFEEEADTVERFLRQVAAQRASEAKHNVTASSNSAPGKPQVLSKAFFAGVSAQETFGQVQPGAQNREDDVQTSERGRKLLIEVYFNSTPAEHSIAQTFAPLTDFVVLTHEYDLYSSSDSTILLSILCCGMEKSGLFLPCFVPTGDVHRRTYIGRYHSVTGFCTRYSMQAEKTAPPQCQSVSGLLDLFHLNVGLQSKVPHGETVLVDSESDYLANSHSAEEWNLLIGKENDELSGRCPPSPSFGTLKDPIKTYAATVAWKGVDEKDVIDTTVRLTFDPYGSSSSSSGPSSVTLKLILRSILDYSKFSGNTTDDVNRILFLGNVTDDDDAEEGDDSAMSIRSSPIRLSIKQQGRNGGEEQPAGTEGILSALCAGVLADPVVNTSNWRSMQQARLEGHGDSSSSISGKLHHDDVEAIYPPGSLFSRFAHMSTLTEGISGGGKIKAIESLWSDYVIPGLQKEMDRAAAGQESAWMDIVAATFPSKRRRDVEEVDHNCCLVHQKLQLLHICGASLMGKDGDNAVNTSSSGWGQDDDDEGLFDDEGGEEAKSEEERNRTEKVNHQGDRDEMHTNEVEELEITLIRDPKRKILAPPPLPPAPRCSDQIEKEEAELTALGTTSAAKSTRMWMQKGQLQSDIAAFKALNGEKSTFADFVHWHSKSDFRTTSAASTAAQQNEEDFALLLGQVSERMRVKGNIWLSVWETTKPGLNVPHFNAMEEIATTMQWLRDLPRSNRLLFRQWIAAYTFSNALHRMRQHSLFNLSSIAAPSSPLENLAHRTGRSVGNGLRGLELDWRHLASHSTTENSIVSFSEQGEVWELYRAKRRQLENLEILLSIGISLRYRLGKIEKKNSDEFDPVLTSLLSEAADEAREGPPTVEGVPLPLWRSHLATTLLPPTSLLPPYHPPKPLRRRHTIRAKVERPMNCPAHDQHLHANIDEQETFRIGLALSESLI